jgi:class 3 adenylate cyclase
MRHIGACVCAIEQPSEVLVSQTVMDLVAGSDITFKDPGTRAVEGVPEQWRTHAVQT